MEESPAFEPSSLRAFGRCAARVRRPTCFGTSASSWYVSRTRSATRSCSGRAIVRRKPSNGIKWGGRSNVSRSARTETADAEPSRWRPTHQSNKRRRASFEAGPAERRKGFETGCPVSLSAETRAAISVHAAHEVAQASSARPSTPSTPSPVCLELRAQPRSGSPNATPPSEGSRRAVFCRAGEGI